jgi:hypothetical protein
MEVDWVKNQPNNACVRTQTRANTHTPTNPTTHHFFQDHKKIEYFIIHNKLSENVQIIMCCTGDFTADPNIAVTSFSFSILDLMFCNYQLEYQLLLQSSL